MFFRIICQLLIYCLAWFVPKLFILFLNTLKDEDEKIPMSLNINRWKKTDIFCCNPEKKRYLK